MDLKKLKQLIKELSKDKNNFNLCYFLEKVVKSKNFREGIISHKVINALIALREKYNLTDWPPRKVEGYDYDTLFIIFKILMSKFYDNNIIEEEELLDIINKYSDRNDCHNEVLKKKLIAMLMDKIVFEDHNIGKKEFYEEILEVSFGTSVDETVNRLTEFNVRYNSFDLDIIDLLTCDNFYDGLIKKDDFSFLTKLQKYKQIYVYAYCFNSILNVLKSENYAAGLITAGHFNLFFSNSLMDSLRKIDLKEHHFFEEFKGYRIYWCSIAKVLTSDNFRNGIISYEWLADYYSIEDNKLTEDLTNLFISESYGKCLITKEQIEDILTTLKEKRKSKKNSNCFSGFVNLLISDIYRDNKIKYEDIKFLLDDKYEVFREIINLILDNKDFSREAKEYYILALLEFENKDELCDLCNQNIAKKKVDSIRNYAYYFVSYALPVLFALPKSHVYQPKKKQKNKRNGSRELVEV